MAKHPYHIVDPSPWPIASSGAAFLLAIGAVLFMHDVNAYVLPLGGACVLLVMILWWRDVIAESVGKRLHSDVVKLGLRYGMAMFIASEVMFFAAFFWAFFDASLFPKAATSGAWDALSTVWVPPEAIHDKAGQWPPKGIETLNPFDLPLLNTLILLLSGTTITWGHHAIREGHKEQTVQALAITVLLGIIFTCLQAYEYNHATFGFGEGIYPATFYMATGFHGLHVIIGTLFLAVCLFRTAAGHFTPTSHFGLEAAAWYWHFVDVIWLFLFVFVYWWGG